MRLEKIDRRACEILLSAARREVTVAEFREELQRERIYSPTWMPIFKKLGLICLPIVPGNEDAGSEERVLTFQADNVVAFTPRVSPQMTDKQQECRMSDITDAFFDDAAKTKFLAKFEPADPPRRRPKELLEAQEERLRLLSRDGYTVRIGPNGATVFRGADA